jgi:hypothetical protein
MDHTDVDALAFVRAIASSDRPSAHARLWRQLAARLNEVLPAGFLVRYDSGRSLSIDAPDGYGSSAYVGDCEPALDSTEPLEVLLGTLARRAETVLSNVQDVVSETTRDPWPRAPVAKRVEAPAGARIESGVLHCWYGDEQAPVVTLRPLPLIDIGSRSGEATPDGEI